jgi:spore coat protein U-like protein
VCSSSTPWILTFGSGTTASGNKVTGVDTGGAQQTLICAKIPSEYLVTPGSYSDNIAVTIVYYFFIKMYCFFIYL